MTKDHETEIKLDMYKAQASERENQAITSAYQRAFIDGFEYWFESGMRGRAIDEINRLLTQRGVIS